MAKFASITSSLLARKGEAMPWSEGAPPAPARFPEKPEPLFRAEARVGETLRSFEPPPAMPRVIEHAPRRPPEPIAPHEPEAVRRCTVRMTQREYERLGIMAVKKDLTRQQFLHDALARVLDEIAREFPRQCACIGEGCGSCR